MGKDGRLPSAGAELIAALGLVFVVAGVVTWSTSVLPTTDATHAALYELVVHVMFGGVVLVLGIHTERSNLEADQRFDVMVWCFSGFLFLVGLTVWGEIDTLLAGGLSEAFVSDVVVFGSMGGAFGVVAGVNWGHAARNRELAETNEEQRETLVLLTRLLRHDIRNDVTAINGHADLVAEHVDPAGEPSLEVIQRRTDGVIRLLRDTDTLVETLGGERELEALDLSEVLREEVANIVDAYPAVDVRANVPEDLSIVADGLVHQLFSNLLENAVAHNDPEDLRIDVEATDAGEDVVVVVSDDGVGVPEYLREDCFDLGEQGERSDGDGLGLYLVSRLADVYGGSVVLETATDGATFRVSLPAADEP